MARARLLLTCEHGGNAVPARYRALFAGCARELASHRGYDLGALALARAVARRLVAPLVYATTTRLFVDLNRSSHHRGVLSRHLGALAAPERARVLERHHRPHRARVERAVRELLAAGAEDDSVLHVAVHSFTPRLAGVVRAFDVGLLYDPRRSVERRAVERWRCLLAECAPELRVRRNAPYRGVSDGLTTHLRRALGTARYVGLELEVNQRLLVGRHAAPRRVADAVAASLSGLCRG